MAMWKKMAAAFGRALEDPSATEKGRDLIVESKTVTGHPDRSRLVDKETPAQAAFQSGRREANRVLRGAIETAGVPDEAKRIWENYDFDYERAYGPRDAYNRAVERAKNSEDDYLPGSAEEFEERYGFAVDGELPDRKNAVRHQFDEEMERRSDKALEDDFDKAFKSNINRRKERVRGGFGGESAEVFEDQLWNIIDELEANGKSGNEILDMLRVDKPKAPYGE